MVELVAIRPTCSKSLNELRSHGDGPTDLPSLEQLAEKAKESIEKPPPHARPLRRSHTDPTDLLWVFRRRANLLEHRVHHDDFASNQNNGCNEPYRAENDESNDQTKQGSSDGLIDKVSA
ncbi:hypothetical protein OS493_030797 [Desmophyllum pertusum]|uniref:Uncharacterized protein n=1 Tax=Desmophyllum pertusum TaxID=174260 RepID=A0A9W9YWC7_9CNID|nr:hypothetical protein OS493_030797 [Desmophyllum pertusum]